MWNVGKRISMSDGLIPVDELPFMLCLEWYIRIHV